MKGTDLYAVIKEYGKFTESGLEKNPLQSWSSTKIEKFIIDIYSEIAPLKRVSKSYFNFYANSTLSGEPYPCSAFECRIRNVDSLSRFAAFYADKISVKSPIDKHFNDLSSGQEVDRDTLYVDILILMRLKPLVLANILEFTTEYMCLCKECLKKVVADEATFKDKVSTLEKEIIEDCKKQINCSIKRDYGYPYLAITNAEKYGHHSQTDILFKQYIPDEISKILLKNPNQDRDIVLSPRKIEALGIADYILGPSLKDLLESNIYSEQNNSTYLTNSDFDVEMINRLHTPTQLESSKELSKDLLHQVPLLAEIDIKDVVKLRCQDGESFKVYRDSINKLLANISTYDSKDIANFQRDVIIPEINKMDLTIKNSRKAILGSTAFDFAFWSASISIGLFSGLLPLKAAPILGAVGGLSTIKDIASKAKDCIFSNNSIKNENFYFLWKLLKK